MSTCSTMQGKEVIDPFLPLDAEFWNDDRTRYTVFFDPGRQKRGIPVIDEMGRSLTEGKSYTLVVDKEWRDGNGLPAQGNLQAHVQGRPARRAAARSHGVADRAAHRGHARAADRRVSRTARSRVAAARVRRAGRRRHADRRRYQGRAQRSGVVVHAEGVLEGRPHHIVAFAMLEDLAGNRIGRAFEVDQFDRSDKSAEPEKTLIPFQIR